MALGEIDELDLWRGEAVIERMVRLASLAFGGLGTEADAKGMKMDTHPAKQVMTPEERRLSAHYHGAAVTVEAGRYRDDLARGCRVKTVKERYTWRGANEG